LTSLLALSHHLVVPRPLMSLYGIDLLQLERDLDVLFASFGDVDEADENTNGANDTNDTNDTNSANGANGANET